MANLENILGSTFGDEAIKRLNRNTILINQELGQKGTQLDILSARTQMSTYTTLEQLDLADADFTGLTKTQAFDLLLTKLTRFKSLYIRLSSDFNNLRTAIGYTGISTLRVDVYKFERYTAKLVGEETFFTWECSGYPGFSTEWQPIATADIIDLLWVGNTTTTGEITLNSTASGKYNAFIIDTGFGANYMRYTSEQGMNTLLPLTSPTHSIVYQTYSGIGKLVGVDSTGIKLNLSETGGQPLRGIYGIVRGNR